MLINPPIYDFAYYDLFSKPLGLLRLGKWLKRGGWETVHINALDPYDRESVLSLGGLKRKANGTGKIFRQVIPWPDDRVSIGRHYARYGIMKESLARQIESQNPDLILITSGMTYWYEGVRETVSLCRSIHPDVPVGVGGIYATLMEDHCRRVCGPDYVFKGEGEKALREQLGDRFPLPEFPLTDEADWDDPVWKDSAVIRLNKGCPMNCEYCASRIIEPRFIPGDPERAFEQVRYIHEKWGTRHFAFYDDALLVHSTRLVKPFLEKIIRLGQGSPILPAQCGSCALSGRGTA